MEIAVFIASAMAGAVLKEVAKDAYASVKQRLSDAFGLGATIELLETEPGGKLEQEILGKKLLESGAVEDAIILDGAAQIADELTKLTDDTPLGSSMTIKDFKAARASFEDIRIRAGAAMKVEKFDVKGTATFKNIQVGEKND